jgi:hypothetical protein
MKTVLVGALILLSAACTARYHTGELTGAPAHLDSQKSVFITISEDGIYSNKTYGGSGQTVAQAVAQAFSRRGIKVDVADNRLTEEKAIEAAKKLNAGYLVAPVITHWEQRATEWSGRPSRMAIRITVTDVETAKRLMSTAIEGRSRTFSFVRTSPDLLLRDPLINYVDGLYCILTPV